MVKALSYSQMHETGGLDKDGYFKDPGQTRYTEVYPNPADQRIYLQGEKVNQFHLIEDMQLINVQGRIS